MTSVDQRVQGCHGIGRYCHDTMKRGKIERMSNMDQVRGDCFLGASIVLQWLWNMQKLICWKYRQSSQGTLWIFTSCFKAVTRCANQNEKNTSSCFVMYIHEQQWIRNIEDAEMLAQFCPGWVNYLVSHFVILTPLFERKVALGPKLKFILPDTRSNRIS